MTGRGSDARRHVVVVGSGIAGLVCAIEASATHRVTLLTKAELGESNTRYAQGGIAVALFPDDSAESHTSDTLYAGAGLSDEDIVRVLCTEGPDRVRDLIRFGVEFDRTDGELTRGLEAAHSSARIVHAGGDATGAVVERALVRTVLSRGVLVREQAFVEDLVVSDGAVRGVRVLVNGEHETVEADAVVIASGGAGQLYLHTTNPTVTTGDGVAAALRAGAVLSDLEFYQFHPTALARPGNFLISEAVRGEGAVLVGEDGARFMPAVHPLAELAPRDVVARGIADRMAQQDGHPVQLDATALGRDFLARRFPSITAECARHGIDWSRETVPVTPAAHYWMGGILTDDEGRTSIRGLYAVGEAANTGVHGANRLASNSLLESTVFAHRCAAALGAPWSDLGVEAGPLPVDAFEASAVYPLRDAALTPFSRQALQTLMWTHAGLSRSERSLTAALAQLWAWEAPAGDSAHDLEDANLLQLARALTWAALARTESRGAHFRSDHPDTDPAFAHHLRWSARPVLPALAAAGGGATGEKRGVGC